MNSRRFLRLFVLAVIAVSSAACHFHGGGHHGWSSCYSPPVRHCR